MWWSACCGSGSALVQEVIAAARAARSSFIKLNVAEADAAALTFYRRLGFGHPPLAVLSLPLTAAIASSARHSSAIAERRNQIITRIAIDFDSRKPRRPEAQVRQNFDHVGSGHVATHVIDRQWARSFDGIELRDCWRRHGGLV